MTRTIKALKVKVHSQHTVNQRGGLQSQAETPRARQDATVSILIILWQECQPEEE